MCGGGREGVSVGVWRREGVVWVCGGGCGCVRRRTGGGCLRWCSNTKELSIIVIVT